MKIFLLLLAALCSGPAFAYTSAELRGDCEAAEALAPNAPDNDPRQVLQGARCTAYVMGFADGYAISDYLAEKVGVRLNAICLPQDEHLPQRLVRAVLNQFDRQPQNNNSTATIVAGALARSFPCPETLEPSK
jgi:hypothetical protein